MMVRNLVTVLALALAACSPSSGDAAASTPAGVHAESGLRVIPLTIQRGDKKLSFRVEVAGTQEEQAKGLMFRTTMGENEGMIFPMKPPRQASFWMRNTVMSLDLIFIGVDGRISNIAADAVPYDETPLLSVGMVKAVLELNGGRAAELGIVAGDRVEW
jgi:uncharacterized membrane protein (UPF0127 family)